MTNNDATDRTNRTRAAAVALIFLMITWIMLDAIAGATPGLLALYREFVMRSPRALPVLTKYLFACFGADGGGVNLAPCIRWVFWIYLIAVTDTYLKWSHRPLRFLASMACLQLGFLTLMLACLAMGGFILSLTQFILLSELWANDPPFVVAATYVSTGLPIASVVVSAGFFVLLCWRLRRHAAHQRTSRERRRRMEEPQP